MATIFFDVRSVSRGRGSSAVQRAAYISREKVRDERTRSTYDYRARGGLEHAEIFRPTTASAEPATWARDRSSLWNAAEQSEHRRDSRVAREFVVALPHELGTKERLTIAREFAQTLADRYRVITDLAVHRPPDGGDPRNHHAHILSTTREVTSAGLGRKSDLEVDERYRRANGLVTAAEQLRLLRHAWADHVNEHLRAAHLDVSIDARSYWEQGSARVPQTRLGHRMIQLERAGVVTDVAERIRANDAERQRLMSEYARAHALGLSRPQNAEMEHAPEASAGNHSSAIKNAGESARPLTLDEIQRRAAERWVAYQNDRARGKEISLRRPAERTRDYGAEFDI